MDTIGIFDSGIGGLTVFRALSQYLPQENLIYLGDTARVPYGTKSSATVIHYSLDNVRFLLSKGVKMIVVACNTASAFAIDELRQHFSLPIIGVIEPGAYAASQVTQKKRVGVIGTEGTIRSGAYARHLKLLEPTLEVTSAACPLFVPLVEEGWLEGAVTEKVAAHYLKPLLQAKIDTLILGCTHYPLLKEVIRSILGESVHLIDSADETAHEVSRQLKNANLLRKDFTKPTHQFFVTDSPERFQRVGALFLGDSLKDVQRVEIP